MAEERIIDDEYGRGVKLRKTKDGYIDVTDEALDGAPEEEVAEEEISFAFPILEGEEDDEDLVGLTPEEAAELRKQKAEVAERRRAEYEATVEEGNALLSEKSFHAAELKFEKALQLDDPATEATVGYWRAKTEDFTDPDALIEEYVDAGIESLEYDLGYEAVEEIKKTFRPQLEKRYEELKTEEEPLFLEVTGKQERRRTILKARRKKSLISFVIAALPTLVCAVLAIVFGALITTTPDNRYVAPTIAFAVAAVVLFLVFTVFANKLINACRMYSANEKLASTEEGERLSQIMEYKDLYEAILEISYEE